MFKKTLLCSLMVLGLLGFSQNAQSNPKAGQFFISPMFGGHWFEGNQDPFGDDATLEHGITYGLGFGYQMTKSLGLELVVNYTDSESNPMDKDLDAYPVRLDLFYNLTKDSAFVPYVAAGAGIMEWSQQGYDNDTDTLFNYGFGVKYFMTDNIALRADVRHLITNDELQSNMLYTVGFVFAFGGEEEKAVEPVAPVEEPEEEPVAVQEEEKPVEAEAVAEVDSDGDGIVDSLDKCADTPSGIKVDENGCPADSDGDGVTDDKDNCPGTPAGAKVTSDGCPYDTDGDGVIDDKDKCPNTPKGTKVDGYGCPVVEKPVVKDSDNDGVADDKDKCKDTPAGANVNAHGCWVVKDLYFKTGKSVIMEDSKKNVDEVIVVMQKNPDMKIEVQGYTDNKGSVKMNQKLSEKRAKAVMDYMVSKGVAKNRITAKGYGVDNPVDTNDTEEGRANNRRVELKPEI